LAAGSSIKYSQIRSRSRLTLLGARRGAHPVLLAESLCFQRNKGQGHANKRALLMYYASGEIHNTCLIYGGERKSDQDLESGLVFDEQERDQSLRLSACDGSNPKQWLNP